MMPQIEQITAQDLHARRQAGETFTLIDVREPWEHEHAAIAGDELHPLGEIYHWGPTLDRAARYVVYCHTGVRSAHACMLLKQMGVPSVLNLRGGIDAWSRTVDPSVPRY